MNRIEHQGRSWDGRFAKHLGGLDNVSTKKNALSRRFFAIVHTCRRLRRGFHRSLQAQLTLLHAVDFGAYVSPGTPDLWRTQATDLSREAAEWASETIKTYLAEDLKHLDVGRQVVQGDPALKIVAAAKQSGTDLIMMPCHGLSVFRRYILGSVTAKVLHDADCAVWTGVHLEHSPPLETIRFRKVRCAVDLGPQSARALRWASGFSSEHSAELIVVHAVPAAGAQTRLNGLEDKGRKELQELLNALEITARVIVAGGEPAKRTAIFAPNGGPNGGYAVNAQIFLL